MIGFGGRLLVLKIFLLLFAVFYPGAWYLKRMGDIEGVVGIAAFLGFFSLCLLALVGAAFCRNLPVRILLALPMAASVVVTEAYRAITAEFFSYDAFVTILEAAAFADNAIQQFDAQILVALLIGVALFLGIVLPPRIEWLKPKRIVALCAIVPVVLVLLLSFTVYARGGAGSKGLPSYMVALPYLLVRGVVYVRFSGGERQPVQIASENPVALDIVLIVDESVRGDYLDINGAERVISGLRRDDGSVHNFGLASAATNCSAGSNVILRFGGTRDKYLEAIHIRPSIWAYAKAAGMRTVYLDAQRTGGGLQNYMYASEVREIDEFVQFGDTEILYRDMRIADWIAELTQNDVSEFILANKIGAHYPVSDKYPDEYLVFEPTTQRGRYAEISDTGDKSGFDGDWLRYTNSYRNTILWNVGEFFNRIFERADLTRAVMFYTSDHGQDFHEDGRPGLAFHCSSSPSPNEGLVPVVVITREPHWSEQASLWSRRNHHGISHFRIFPSLLEVMGYEGDEVRPRYGASLFESDEDPMTFIAGFDRFNDKPRWCRVEVPVWDRSSESRSMSSPGPPGAAE